MAWEDADSGASAQGGIGYATVKRTPFDRNKEKKGLMDFYGWDEEKNKGINPFVNYYLVSPSYDTTLKQ